MRTLSRLCSLLALVPLHTLAACAEDPYSADNNAPVESNPQALSWVSPATTVFEADSPVALTVSTANPSALIVRWTLDGDEVAFCDSSDASSDCHRDALWSATITTSAVGSHVLRAYFTDRAGATVETSRMISVVAAGSLPPLAPEDQTFIDAQGGLVGDALGARGFLDPDRAFHSVFGGIEWSVQGQRVKLRSGTPSGSVDGVAQCMLRYGDSIKRWADRYNISRAALLATAITESGCTNPAGSSDGLSSGPTQVTASTCSAITGLSQSTCRTRMHSNPDFSFEVAARYMASSYQRGQHNNDPPKIAAAYNAGSIRRTSQNRWRMVTTGNHIDRFVSAYNAYRAWETTQGVRFEFRFADGVFNGESVRAIAQLPSRPADGTTVFVGDWAHRDGHFATFMGTRWVLLSE